MNLLNFYLASIPATIAMTAYSYAVSKIFKKLFKEPILLGYLLFEKRQDSVALGWLAHFVIGAAFAWCYYCLHVLDLFPFTLSSYLLLSVLSGVAGIFSWMVLFNVTKKRVRLDAIAFYTQLFFAHIIFTMVFYAVISWVFVTDLI